MDWFFVLLSQFVWDWEGIEERFYRSWGIEEPPKVFLLRVIRGVRGKNPLSRKIPRRELLQVALEELWVFFQDHRVTAETRRAAYGAVAAGIRRHADAEHGTHTAVSRREGLSATVLNTVAAADFEEQLLDRVEKVEKQVAFTALMATVKATCLSNAANIGQGMRDYALFTLWVGGASPEALLTECPWLKSRDSVRIALTRVVERVRAKLGVSQAEPVAIFPERRVSGKKKYTRKFVRSEYSKEYYERNASRLREWREKHKEVIKRRRREGLSLGRAAVEAEVANSALHNKPRH